jgi:hypothetical protein
MFDIKIKFLAGKFFVIKSVKFFLSAQHFYEKVKDPDPYL